MIAQVIVKYHGLHIWTATCITPACAFMRQEEGLTIYQAIHNVLSYHVGTVNIPVRILNYEEIPEEVRDSDLQSCYDKACYINKTKYGTPVKRFGKWKRIK